MLIWYGFPSFKYPASLLFFIIIFYFFCGSCLFCDETICGAYFSFYNTVKFSLILSLNAVSVLAVLSSSTKALMNFSFTINIFYIFIFPWVFTSVSRSSVLDITSRVFVGFFFFSVLFLPIATIHPCSSKNCYILSLFCVTGMIRRSYDTVQDSELKISL